MTSIEMLDGDFATLPDLVRAHAVERPDAVAAADPVRRLSWSELDQLTDRIAARLQQDGFRKGDRTAIAGLNSVEQMAVILGTLRAGGVAGLVTNSATGEQMAAMIADTGARHLFLDGAAKASLAGQAITASELVAMDGSDAGTPIEAWLSLAGARPVPVDILPEDGFNIIYSSGTTGTPKGIVHSHAMRWQHILRGAPAYGPNAVTILSTPLYSNTTMASFLPTVG
ncbi:class I adenylate-forming enzyme family protein, partial [Sphingopyxis sp. H115]|uniref:class I adenylate-forming enzyme family protein n=1 Tax=Sphingopyxis sp. H115 TaxID=1759073 RepID=UPI000AA714BE